MDVGVLSSLFRFVDVLTLLDQIRRNLTGKKEGKERKSFSPSSQMV